MESSMLLNIITVYLLIFFIITYMIYFIYSLAILHFSKKISSNIVKRFESYVYDYAILILALFIFLLLNHSIFHIEHSIFRAMEYVIALACGTFLSSIIAHNLVHRFKMMPKSEIISYILLFLLIFMLYTAVVIKPFAI